jgi:cytoskeletal protein RodZ
MTEGYLTTDIVVIVVLIVVLILIGACAFLTHFYWTKIGVAEIWNTAKWSSMRSSFYRTVRRFSQASSKFGSERPMSGMSAYSDDADGSALPAPLRNKKPTAAAPAPARPPVNQPPAAASVASKPANNNVRRNSGNQIKPVSTIAYKSSSRPNYGTRIGQPPENTQIHNVHEYDDGRDSDPSVVVQTHRF